VFVRRSNENLNGNGNVCFCGAKYLPSVNELCDKVNGQLKFFFSSVYSSPLAAILAYFLAPSQRKKYGMKNATVIANMSKIIYFA